MSEDKPNPIMRAFRTYQVVKDLGDIAFFIGFEIGDMLFNKRKAKKSKKVFVITDLL